MSNTSDYPKEYFVKIDGNDFLEIRLEVNLLSGPRPYCVEINIVQKNSNKIYQHLKTLYGYYDEEESLREANHFIANYKSS